MLLNNFLLSTELGDAKGSGWLAVAGLGMDFMSHYQNSGDLADANAKSAIVQGAVWDYLAIEDMLGDDDSFVANISDVVHPQIWTQMYLPMAGDGEEGPGVPLRSRHPDICTSGRSRLHR